MIISHKYKCIYVRIPKTGSTSVEDFFKELDPDCIYSSDVPPYGHETASQLAEKYGHTIWNSYYKFSFVRNPYNWYRSYYSDLLNYSWDENSELANKSLKLILTPENSLPVPVGNVLHEKHILILQTLNDFWFYPDIHENTMEHVTQTSWLNKPLDYIGRTEFLDEDFRDVCDKLNIPYIGLKKLNSSESHNLKHSIKAKELIRCIASDDFDLYFNTKKITNTRY